MNLDGSVALKNKVLIDEVTADIQPKALMEKEVIIQNCPPKLVTNLSWLEQMEQMVINLDQDELKHDSCTSQSALRIKNEAFVCEVCYSKNKQEKLNTSWLDHDMGDQTMLQTENDEEITELAIKCYKSDSEIEVPRKQNRGGRKKKPIVLLECTTHSNKHY